jgi:predicted tellurium resistance membrane protein TerC
LETTLVQDAWLVFQVILLDLALGGDNSVVIGMAAKNLPRHLQTRAILWGTAGAIGMRFIMGLSSCGCCRFPF